MIDAIMEGTGVILMALIVAFFFAVFGAFTWKTIVLILK